MSLAALLIAVSASFGSCIHEATQLLGGVEDAASVMIVGILYSRGERKKMPSATTWRASDLIVMKRRPVDAGVAVILVTNRSVADLPKYIISGLALISSEADLPISREADQL